jgi:hypothetical protein
MLNSNGAVALLNTGIHNLQTLSCASCSLNNVAIQALFPPIDSDRREEQSKLQILNLSDNQIRLQGIQALMPYLHHPKFQIHSLDLDWNPIEDAGAMAIAEMLQSNSSSSLTELSLNRCFVRDAGVQSILEALPHNHTLKILRLADVICSYSREENEDGGDVTLANNVYNTLAETIPRCHLEKLTLTGPRYDKLIGSPDEIERYQDSVVQGFAANTALKEVILRGSILDSSREKQVSYYTLRNTLQPFLDVLDHEITKNEDTLQHGAEIPRGLWACILAAADRQFSNASALYYLLSARPNLILATAEKDDTSTASKIPCHRRRSKRLRSQDSKSSSRPLSKHKM